MSGTSSQDLVLKTLEDRAAGRNTGQELVFNPRTGAFEVATIGRAQSNPDTVVAPYDEDGFFCCCDRRIARACQIETG